VSTRAGLDTEARRKILCFCRGSKSGRPVRSRTQYGLSYPSSVFFTGSFYYFLLIVGRAASSEITEGLDFVSIYRTIQCMHVMCTIYVETVLTPLLFEQTIHRINILCGQLYTFLSLETLHVL
jgi:hypothetical protein